MNGYDFGFSLDVDLGGQGTYAATNDAQREFGFPQKRPAANAAAAEAHAYNPTHAGTGAAPAHLHHHHHHHGLLMAAYHHPASLQQQQQQQALSAALFGGIAAAERQPFQNSFAAVAAAAASSSMMPLEPLFLPAAGTAHSVASAAAAASSAAKNLSRRQQQQRPHHPHPSSSGGRCGSSSSHHHQRKSSFDELLGLPPNLLSPGGDPFASLADAFGPPAVVSSSNPHAHQPNYAQEEGGGDAWLDEIRLEVSAISLDPMNGRDAVQRLREELNNVVTRYIPCCDFLVQCQQELRKGLESSRRGHGRRGGVTPKQFFAEYVGPLPNRFYVKNVNVMEETALNEAYAGLQKLRGQAKAAERQGCEAVKSNFLGGMKEGQSWGLRQWLSRHGSALKICTDLESLLHGCRGLDRSSDATRRLGRLLRPLCQRTLDRLTGDIPASYQQHSTAHPYLPFFHRLESALRGMARFDPDDDGVVCIDDSDDDEVEEVLPPSRKRAEKKAAAAAAPMKPAPAEPPTKKRKFEVEIVDLHDSDDDGGAESGPANDSCVPQTSVDDSEIDDEEELVRKPAATTKAARTTTTTANDDDDDDDGSSSGESEDGSVVEIVHHGTLKVANDDWRCPTCCAVNGASAVTCIGCGEISFQDLTLSPTPPMDFGEQQQDDSKSLSDLWGEMDDDTWPFPVDKQQRLEACGMANNLDRLAVLFETNQQGGIRPCTIPRGTFWDGHHYAQALRLFGNLLRSSEAAQFVERIDEDRLIRAGNPPYSHVVRHPLCFGDIVKALMRLATEDNLLGDDGWLPVQSLSNWNMWRGTDLLQAIDLVLLNSLAYGKALRQGKSQHRSSTNKIRKKLWEGIKQIVGETGDSRRKQCMPTRRSETSGFVVYKIQS